MTKKKTKAEKADVLDHIVLGSKGEIQCLHCGASYDPYAGGKNGLVEVRLMIDIGRSFERQHRACPKPSEVRCSVCLELGHEFHDHVRLKVLTAAAWRDCGDNGLSSAAIWFHFTGTGIGGPLWPEGSSGCLPSPTDVPRDPSDFGRCHRLLAASWAEDGRGRWRARIGEMGKYSPVWARVAGAWEELEALYAEERTSPDGKAPKLYERLQELQQLGHGAEPAEHRAETP